MMTQRAAFPAAACLLAFTLSACNSANNNQPFQPGDGPTPTATPPPTEPGLSTFIEAKIFAPNQTTPIANATVYQGAVDDRAAKNLVVGTDCPEPSAPAAFATCSDANGNFVLEVSPDGGTVTITVEKGAFRQTFEVEVSGAGSAEEPISLEPITLSSSPESGAPRIAVVAGAFDNIEDVVESIGFEFDLVRGEIETTSLFTASSAQKLTDYDIVFINCGAPDVLGGSVEGEARRDYLRSYVEGGGRIYVTDLAADYITETFPEIVTFAGFGEGDVELDAEVKLEILGAYLDGRTCSDASGSVPCRNEDGTVHITGFGSGWRVIGDATAEFQDSVTFYTEGEVTYTSEATGQILTEVRPLNFAFPIGLGGVVYSSYHTVDDEATGLPQERVLEFLVFE